MKAEVQPKNHIHFHNLGVLRFVAAFMIVIVHGYGAIIGWEGLPEPLRKDPTKVLYTPENLNSVGLFLQNLIQNFDLGVEFFFLISGFLITYLMLSEIQCVGKLNIPKFYMRRLLRIWPLYFLILCITPFIARWTDSAEPHYWWNIFFANNYITIFQKFHEPGLAHYWSICVEEHFYLVWPILLFVFPVKRLPLLFATLIFLSILSRWYYFQTSPEWLNHAKLNTICRMDTLAIGGWLAWLMHYKPFQINTNGWIRALVYITFVMLLCFDDTHQTESFFLVAFKRLVYTTFFCFLLLNYLYNPQAWFNFKKKNILHYLGKISFGIYMYHNILFGIIFKKIIWNNNLFGFWIFWVIYLSIVLVIAVLSFELFEKHILKLKDRFAVVRTNR
jgi:peptidoglycan/LPS O-acetylase OafA/YrhL